MKKCFLTMVLFFGFALMGPSIPARAQEEALTPSAMSWWARQAREFLRDGEFLRAESAFRKVVVALEKQSEPEAALVSLSIGDLFLNYGHFEAGYPFHSKAAALLAKLSQTPEAGQTIMGVGNRYLERGLAAAAAQLYLRVGDWAGDAVEHEKAIRLAQSLQALGDNVAAMATLRKFMKLHADPNGNLLFNLSWIQLQGSQHSKALHGFLKVTEDHPAAEWADAALYYAATAQLSKNNPQGAKKLLDTFISDYPQSELMDEVHVLMGKLEEPSS